MAARSNALSELTRFWLEARHGCLVQESIPVPVPYALSDIDFLTMHPRAEPITLPDGAQIGPRFIVETKDEHDWEPLGKAFAADLLGDLAHLDESGCIPSGTKGVKFSMLRVQHTDRAAAIFGTPEFDRLFVVHAIDRAAMAPVTATMAAHRIHVTTVSELVADLATWYRAHPRPSGLRHTLTGDLWHLLVGFCGMRLPE